MSNVTTETTISVSSRKETRVIYPYGDGNYSNSVGQMLDKVFDGSTFSAFQGMPLSDETCYLPPETDPRNISPEFHLKVETTNLIDYLGGDIGDYKISLSSVSPKLKRYEKLDEWTISECPSEYKPSQEQIRNVQIAAQSAFILSLRYVGPPIAGYGLKRGKILKRKFFNIRPAVESFSFPIRYANLADNEGYPSDALWVINWLDDNYDSSTMGELLEVVVNEDAREHLTKANEARGSEGISMKMLAMQVLTEIFATVLVNGSTPSEIDDSNTLVNQIYTHLQSVSGKPISTIETWVDNDGYPDLNKLRGYVAKLVNVVVQEEKS